MRDDLGTPQALGVLWETLKSEEYAPEEKWGLLEDAEAHLGLSLLDPPTPKSLAPADVSQDIRELLTKREVARRMKDFPEADRLREEMKNRGYHVEDGPKGPVLTREA